MLAQSLVRPVTSHVRDTVTKPCASAQTRAGAKPFARDYTQDEYTQNEYIHKTNMPNFSMDAAIHSAHHHFQALFDVHSQCLVAGVAPRKDDERSSNGRDSEQLKCKCAEDQLSQPIPARLQTGSQQPKLAMSNSLPCSHPAGSDPALQRKPDRGARADPLVA